MTTWLITHPACLEHTTGSGHPERPERLAAVLEALRDSYFEDLHWHEASCATREQLCRIHAPDYVDRLLQSVPAEGLHMLDADTIIGPRSGEAALRAAGAVCMGVDASIAGTARRVFCAVRPPGHHAERSTSMGFCLFNNIAIGAAHACAAHGLERVAVVDFDVHHGNGSEHSLAGRSGFLYLSSHQSPLFPGTGRDEHPTGGNVVNAPLRPLAGSIEFRRAWESTLLPELERYRPQLLLVSAGFDAHRADPLANLMIDEDDFGWLTQRLAEIADACCGGRIVSALEGGYALDALARCAEAHVAALLTP